jgi:hexosaminidase
MKQLLLAVSLLLFGLTQAQEINIIPKPLSAQKGKGNFILSAKTVIVIGKKEDRPSADFLNSYLKQFYGFTLKIVPKANKNFIRLTTPTFIKAPDNEERYTLNVSHASIDIQGDSHRGTFNGVQTFIQLLPVNDQRSTINKTGKSLKIPAVIIQDQPRFSYRGMHLDVGRHFFPVSFIKKYIDYLALHKFNTFHWHLTEDQGWRIEIKKYPKLTTVGGWRNGTIIGRYPGKGNDSIHYGGFYTQDEIKEVVRYASHRFITVIPEIEMPGHSSAAIAAYPELSCFPGEDTKVAKGTAWAGPTKGKQVQQAWGVFEDVFCAGKDKTFTMLEGVLDEVMQLFPSQYIHIGGDECPKANWKRCPNCQQRIKELGLKDEHELQSYFIQRIEKYLNGKGKQIIGWDEILEGGLAPNATVMSWRGEQGGIDAAKQNHDVVMTPGNWCYFDHSQSRNEDSVTIGGYTPIEEVYSYEPQPAALNAEQAKHILGAQANVWTEYMKNTRKVEYQVFPRIAAMSEVLWTAKEKKDSADFERRLLTQFKRYDLWKVNYSNAFFAVKSTILPTEDNKGVLLKLESKLTSGFQVYGVERNLISGFGITTESSDTFIVDAEPPFLITKSADYIVYYSAGNKVYSFSQKISFNKATGKKITTSIPPSPSYPGNGGAFGLVNGVRADKFNSTEWLGWTKPVEITIDLGKDTTFTEVALHAWKQEPSWIYLPASVEITITREDSSEQKFTQEQPATGWLDDRKLRIKFEPVQHGRFITIKVNPVMKIPEGRQGAGKAAWVFLDEIEIN